MTLIKMYFLLAIPVYPKLGGKTLLSTRLWSNYLAVVYSGLNVFYWEKLMWVLEFTDVYKAGWTLPALQQNLVKAAHTANTRGVPNTFLKVLTIAIETPT